MKEYTVKFKDNGKSYGYGYHIGMYRLFGAEKESDGISIPRFQVLGNGIARFYTDADLKNTEILAFPPISEDCDPVATGFNIMFAPTRKDRHISGKAVPVEPTPDGKAYIRKKLLALLASEGINDVSDVQIDYGHSFSEQFKTGIGVHGIMTALATVKFASPHNISNILKKGYGKFKFDGLGCVTHIFYETVSES